MQDTAFLLNISPPTILACGAGGEGQPMWASQFWANSKKENYRCALGCPPAKGGRSSQLSSVNTAGWRSRTHFHSLGSRPIIGASVGQLGSRGNCN